MVKIKAFELINPKHNAITVNILTPGLQPVRGISLSRFGKETITPEEAESPEIKKFIQIGRLELKPTMVKKLPKKAVVDTNIKSARETKPEVPTAKVPEGERVKEPTVTGKGKSRTKVTAADKA